LDLRLVVGRFVDRNANLATGARHGAGLQARQLAFDVEIANFAEIEETLVETGPAVEIAAKDIVRDVIDGVEPRASVFPALLVIRRSKVHVIDRAFAVAVDEIDNAATDALDRRNVELHRPDRIFERSGAELDRAAVRLRCIFDAKGHRASGRTVFARKTRAVAVGLGIDDEVDAALAIERDALRTVLGHGAEI